MEIGGTKPNPIRSARTHSRNVSARFTSRSSREGLASRAFVHHEGRSSISITDGGRRDLRVRADRRRTRPAIELTCYVDRPSEVHVYASWRSERHTRRHVLSDRTVVGSHRAW